MRPVSFGGHISARGAASSGLGLRRTSRRVGQLVRYTWPHKLRALTAIGALLGVTATTIGGPLMAKQAIDRGITPGDFGQVELWVAAYLAGGAAGLGVRSGAELPHHVGRRAGALRPSQRPVRATCSRSTWGTSSAPARAW